MKISKTLALLIAASMLPLICAQAQEKKPADAAAKPTEADVAWKEIETLMKGPAERPKSREEAMVMFKKMITAYDEKSAAFRKGFPKDPRRWELAIQEVQMNGARGMVGLKPKSDEELGKALDEVLAADDATKAVKGMASFSKVMTKQSNPEEFAKAADAHMKAYPEFEGNDEIKGELAKIAMEKELKTKPLELKFKATDGTEIDIEKLRGKVVLVDFWATWCGPCMAEVPNVVASYDKLHPKGFEILGISFDKDKAKLDSVTKEKGMKWPQYFDGKGWQNEFGQKFGIDSIPRMWLVNKKGFVVDTEARENLAEKVEKLLAE